MQEMHNFEGQAVMTEQERAHRLAQLQLELKVMLEERFARNLEALAAFDPALAKRYAHYRPRRAFDFFCLENGVPNLEFRADQRIFYPCENPQTYCAQQVEELLDTQKLIHSKFERIGDLYGQLHLRYCNQMSWYYDQQKFAPVLPREAGVVLNCLMIGCGLGYQLAELYGRIEVFNLILIEPDEDLFYASLHAFDWASLLSFIQENNSHLHFFIGMKSEDLFLSMNDLYDQEGKYLASCSWSYVHYASAEIRKTVEELKKHNFQHSNMLGYFDDHLFATSQGIQALQHCHFVRKDLELPECYRTQPLFIVANGPSLDQDIAFLRRYQDKAVILACGTALETLYHAGIQPDFYGCTERVYHVADTIRIIPDQSFVDRTIIVGGEVIHPETLALFKHQALFIKPEEPLYALIMQHLPDLKRIRPLLMSNPLVGNLGLAVAVALGFSQVYLFGLDNGRKQGTEKMHSEFNKFYRQDGGYDKGGSYAVDDVVPANFGGECISGKYFILSLGSLGYLCNQVRDWCTVYNCSDGARIEATHPVHSQDLVAQFEHRKALDKEALHKFINEELTEQFSFDETKFQTLIEVEVFYATVDRFIALFDAPVHSRLEFAQKMREAVSCLYQLDLQGKHFVADHLRGSLENFFMILAGIICDCADETRCVAEINKLATLIVDFLKDIRPLYAKQPHFAIGEHLRYYDRYLGNSYQYSKAPELPRRISFISKGYQDEQQTFIKRYE